MRRIVILFLLFLLPLEVFAGIAYEQHLAQEGPHAVCDVHDLSSSEQNRHVYAAAADADSDTASPLNLDLGEAFDVPCKSLREPPARATSPPMHAAFSDKSIVADVPIPVAIA